MLTNDLVVHGRLKEAISTKGIRIRREDVECAIHDSESNLQCSQNLESALTFLGLASSEPGELHADEFGGVYCDDNTGVTLPPSGVKRARGVEMERFKRMKVYKKVRREVAAKDPTGKLVGVRWVDIDKNGEVKARLCAQEFSKTNDRDD